MRSPLIRSVLLSALVSMCVVVPAPCADRPNVIVIFSDDQGTLDLHCYGATDLQTPHLDRMAGEGIKFTQFYVAAPVCSPSRAALLTGRSIQRAGVPGNVPSQANRPGMPTEQVTMAEMFGDAGYRTACIGKWHLGTIPECDPLGQGFDSFRGHWAGCIDNYSHFFYWSGPHFHDMHRNREETWEQGTHFTELMVAEARDFIAAESSQPFFLYLPFNIPHYPMQPADQFREMYADLEEPRRSYAALVTHLDDAVGRVLQQLDESGKANDTIVIFLSDHGHSTEERANFGGGYAGPYRGAKFSLFEAGIRVPCLVRWPGHVPAGETREQMCVSVDWFPTLAKWCNLEPVDHVLDGVSLDEVIRSSAAEPPRTVYHWQLGNQWAVRDGDWKLIVNARDTNGKPVGPEERTMLCNLSYDPSERTNFARQHPDRVKAITAAHQDWLRSVQP